jgi:hypothetical protein
MTRRNIQTYLIMLLLLSATVALAQTEFSAEVVNTGKSDTTTQAKIYFAKDKVRVEPTKKDPRGGGSVIINMASQTTTVIMDQQHMYMEVPAQMANQRSAYNFFRTGDVENACSDWLQMQQNKGGTCHKVGSETVNGRSTVKYEGTNASGDTGTVWLDPKLRFPVKWQGKNGSGELRNIQEGSQPSSLFEVPSDYKKFDMGNMMQRPQ